MAAPPPEVESTLQRLSSHRSVRGVLILASDTGKVIRYSGPMLEEHDTASSSSAAAAATTAGSNAAAGGPSIPSVIANDDAREPHAQGLHDGDDASAHPSSTHNAAVKKYADAVRRIVNNSKESVLGLDEQVGRSRKRWDLSSA